MSPVPSSSKTAPVSETRDVPASQLTEDDKVDTSEDEVANTDEVPSDPEGGGGAFNPVTGEINWDCPCLGGMAHGPCGPEFREAFSCFVYSEDEPKGINCVEKFKGMQDCFRRHPEEYAEGKSDVWLHFFS
jgi:intermembrane space import and assembly protein 40